MAGAPGDHRRGRFAEDGRAGDTDYFSRSHKGRQVLRDHARCIPGYTGHIPGKNPEEVFAVTFNEALHASKGACNRRGRSVGPTVPTIRTPGSIDGGHLNCTTGAMWRHTCEPVAQAASTFHNPRGHHFRAGASIPGYVGFIPGKVAGNCFGKRYAIDNLHGTETRQINDKGAEWNTNWLVACETNKKRLSHGAHTVGEEFKFSKAHPNRQVSEASHAWRIWEPKATHEWLRY
eukprot:TRINITY_DN16796_c0_g3_i1.p1 TRINITY_DN16796_c0_g3~~TRINITY_DN16796_c0_g3_i1.p1  ORF type:complete len:253 (-),score=28.95 TRINITY_DN16796_c0_g3_i1:274-972(-)